jgi:hypothetical protein
MKTLTALLQKLWSLFQPEGRDDYSMQVALQLGLRPIPVRTHERIRRNYIIY